MTQDVEMEQQPPSNSISSTSPSILQHLKYIAALIEVGAYSREVRRIVRVIRWTIQLRKNLKASVVSAFLTFALVRGSEVHSRLSAYVPQADLHGGFWLQLLLIFFFYPNCISL